MLKQRAIGGLLDFREWIPRLPQGTTAANAWDKLWVHYLRVEGAEQLSELPEGYRLPESREAMLRELFVHCDPGDIQGKRVMELGSGLGWLANRMAPFCAYTGVDWSKLAVDIARLHVPGARFLHVSEVRRLRGERHTLDTVVCRNFFIHQNLESTVQLLTFARLMLRPGGRLFADFYWAAPPPPGCVVHPADSPRDTENASCGYHYEREDVQRAARESALTVAEAWIDHERLRHFAILSPAMGRK